MDKYSIKKQMEKILLSDSIDLQHLFNHFSSSDLEDFLEFLKVEYGIEDDAEDNNEDYDDEEVEI